MRSTLFSKRLKKLLDAKCARDQLQKDSVLVPLLRHLDRQQSEQTSDVVFNLMARCKRAPKKPQRIRDLGLLIDFLPFVAAACTRSFAADFKTLVTFLDKYDEMEIRDILDNIRSDRTRSERAIDPKSDLVEEYYGLLNENIADPDIFGMIFMKLKSDRRMDKSNTIKLASRLAFKMPSDTSKTKALGKILDQHKYVVRGMQASKASSGKSAA